MPKQNRFTSYFKIAREVLQRVWLELADGLNDWRSRLGQSSEAVIIRVFPDSL